jgi:hypothetical protein
VTFITVSRYFLFTKSRIVLELTIMIKAIVCIFIILSPAAAQVPPFYQPDPESFSVPDGIPVASSTGSTILLKSYDNLQTAINNAWPGTTLVLPDGYRWIGNLVLPVKPLVKDPAGNLLWITIRSQLNIPDGKRVKPGEPRAFIISPNSLPAIANDYSNSDFTKTCAHYYRFDGISVMAADYPEGNLNWNLILFAAPTNPTAASLSHHIEFHHMYVHGLDNLLNWDSSLKKSYEMVRGMMLEAGNVTVADSYIDNFRSTFMEANAIATITSPGPFYISNNFLEASTENMLFCGTPSLIPGMEPTGIVITGNYFFKRLAWRDSTLGVKVKNLLEFKDAKNVLVDGNVFENVWMANQTGFAILLTPRTGGFHFSSTIQDVVIQNNIIRHAAGGMAIAAYDDAGLQPDFPVPMSALVKASHVTIQNNLFDDISGHEWGSPRGVGFLIMGPPDYLTLSNNTVRFAEFWTQPNVGSMDNAGWWMDMTYGPAINMVVENNALGWDIFGDGVTGPAAVYNAVFNNNDVTNIAPWDMIYWEASPFVTTQNLLNQPQTTSMAIGVNLPTSGPASEAVIKAGNR